MERPRLRVLDVGSTRVEIVARDGKGGKDRVESCRNPHVTEHLRQFAVQLGLLGIP